MSRRDLLPDAGPVLNLRQALYRASRDYRGGQNALALSMGVPADDLAKRLNPTDTRPLKPEWIEEILQLTQDLRILEALGAARGGVVWHEVQAVEANRDTLLALGRYLQDEAGFVSSVAEGSADGIWLLPEVQDLERHGYALIRHLLGIMAGARQAMEDRADG